MHFYACLITKFVLGDIFINISPFFHFFSRIRSSFAHFLTRQQKNHSQIRF